MPRQWMYVLAFVFVLFLIYQSPGQAGDAANAFAGWIGQLLSGIVTFLQSLAGSEGDDTIISNVPDITTGSEPATETTVAEFDGLNTNDTFEPASN